MVEVCWAGISAPRGVPVIDVWYGDVQAFGQNGIPQPYVNILGNVSASGRIASLTQSLNGGQEQPLRIGPDQFRLVDPGDFNAEIAYSSLQRGRNNLRLTATSDNGAVTHRVITINYVVGHSPPSYSIDWSAVRNVQSVAQIVDGKWAIENNEARTKQTGYDRLIDIGSMDSWTNLTGTVELTLDAFDASGFGLGPIVGWRGHTPDGDEQPRRGHPFAAWFVYNGAGFSIYANTLISPETPLELDTTHLDIGVRYIFKFQVAPNRWGESHFSFKVWRSGTVEPQNWQVEADGQQARGSILIGADNCDISVGKINITALDGAEFSQVPYRKLLQSLISVLPFVALLIGTIGVLHQSRLSHFAIMFVLLLVVSFYTPVWMTRLLQRGSTEIAYLLLKVLGLHIVRYGFFLSIHGITTSGVTESRSIRSTMALFILSILAARYWLRNPWKAVLFVSLSFPVSVIQNGMRIATLELVRLHTNSEFVQKNLQREGGVVFFLVGVLMMWPALIWLKRLDRPAAGLLKGQAQQLHVETWRAHTPK
jgi:exosortase/archaeosortase family protein